MDDEGVALVALVEKVVLEDEEVKSAIARLELPAGTKVVADTWPYGESSQVPYERGIMLPRSTMEPGQNRVRVFYG